jgi:DnaK suppressor protein
LVGEVAEQLRHARDEPRSLHASDVLDKIEWFQEMDMEYALLGMKTETVQRLDDALERLDADEYGLCSECEREISDNRLSALPFAIRCLDCESLAEVSPRQYARRPSAALFDEADV